MASIDSVRIVLIASCSISAESGRAAPAAPGEVSVATSIRSYDFLVAGLGLIRLPGVVDFHRPMSPDADSEKKLAAEAAAELVEDGMAVGLGTGSTVAHLLPAIAARGLSDIRCVATSVATEEQARELGIPVEEFSELERLDIAIDGTDQVTPDGWLIKGGGGAHLREKIVAAAADRFVVISDSSKPVDELTGPVPLELFAFGLPSTLARLGADVELRDVPRSPDDGAIADYRGTIGNPAELAARLEADPGVAAHGLFPPALVHDLLIATGDVVSHTHPGD